MTAKKSLLEPVAMATVYTLKMGEELEYANQALPSTSLTRVVYDLRNRLCYYRGAVEGMERWRGLLGSRVPVQGGPASPAVHHSVIDGLADKGSIGLDV